MKINKQKGFIIPLLIGIIAVLIIGGGAYIYTNKKAENSSPLVINSNLPTQTTTQTSTTTINQIALKTLGDYFSQFKSLTTTLNRRIIDYKINKTSIVGDFNKKNQCYELLVDYSVKTAIKPIEGNLVKSDWVAGNGQVGTDNWINNKSENFSLIKGKDNVYTINEDGTTNMGVCNQGSSLPAQTNKTSTITDTTKDWKTYTNIKYGFELMYPAGYKTIEIPASVPTGLEIDLSKGSVFVHELDDSLQEIDLPLNCMFSSKDLEDKNMLLYVGTKEISGTNFYHYINYKSMQEYLGDYCGMSSGCWYEDIYRTLYNSKCYEIEYTRADREFIEGNPYSNPKVIGDVKAVPDIFNQIISTFKFTN